MLYKHSVTFPPLLLVKKNANHMRSLNGDDRYKEYDGHECTLLHLQSMQWSRNCLVLSQTTSCCRFSFFSSIFGSKNATYESPYLATWSNAIQNMQYTRYTIQRENVSRCAPGYSLYRFWDLIPWNECRLTICSTKSIINLSSTLSA